MTYLIIEGSRNIRFRGLLVCFFALWVLIQQVAIMVLAEERRIVQGNRQHECE